MNNKQEKALAIAETIVETAAIMADHAKEFPRTRKMLRFKYNRRPMKKRQRALVLLKMAISKRMAQVRIATIMAITIPKFQKGA